MTSDGRKTYLGALEREVAPVPADLVVRARSIGLDPEHVAVAVDREAVDVQRRSAVDSHVRREEPAAGRGASSHHAVAFIQHEQQVRGAFGVVYVGERGAPTACDNCSKRVRIRSGGGRGGGGGGRA